MRIYIYIYIYTYTCIIMGVRCLDKFGVEPKAMPYSNLIISQLLNFQVKANVVLPELVLESWALT